MRLSFIIPMYNSADFITSCIHSCLNQDLPEDEFEVIVVDDGSTDDSAAVVEAEIKATGDKRLSLIRQTNGRPGKARNTGMEKARGDYIWFIDSDDWVSADCASKLLSQASGADILAFGAESYRLIDGVKVTDNIFKYPFSSSYSGHDYIKLMSDKLIVCVPFHFFRRGYLIDRGLRFVPDLIHEDNEFMARTVLLADRIVVSEEVPYHRFIREGSISRKVTPARFKSFFEVSDRLHDFYLGGSVPVDLKPYWNSMVSNVINQALKLANLNPEEEIVASGEFVDNIIERKWVPEVFRSSKELKYKIEGLLMSMFPGRVMDIYKLIRRFKR